MTAREELDVRGIMGDARVPHLAHPATLDVLADAIQTALAAHDEAIRAEERERIASEVEALPTTRTQAWLKGWDSVPLAEALHIARSADTTEAADGRP